MKKNGVVCRLSSPCVLPFQFRQVSLEDCPYDFVYRARGVADANPLVCFYAEELDWRR